MPDVIRTMQGSFSGMELEVEYQIHFEVDSPGCPAQTSGPPENCYPAEGPEWHVTLVEVEHGGDWVDIRKIYSPELIAHVQSWAENEDLSEECEEAARDAAIAAEEYHAEQRSDPLE